MKKLLIIFVITCFLGCDSEKSLDCFQATGDIVKQTVDVPGFRDIIVFERVKLFISQGRNFKVEIETGENLLNEVNVVVEDSILKLKDNNSCNFVRDYETTNIYVTAPEIGKIRNSSGTTIENIGPLAFEKLTLISEDRMLEDEFHKDGDFNLTQLDVGTLSINSNGISTFYLQGRATNASFGLYDSDARVEAGNFVVDNLRLIHRSTNKMIVNPVNSIRGTIFSIGDVISKNRPPIVEVEELYTGRLIFE